MRVLILTALMFITSMAQTAGRCFMSDCGCPGNFLADWCDENNPAHLTATDFCQASEENCAQCAGTWCDAEVETHPYCITITTGQETNNNGYLEVSVNEVIEIPAGAMFGLGDVVLDACYDNFDSLSLQNTDLDAWTGRISVTFDSEEIALVCDGCTGDQFNGQTSVGGNTDSENQGSVYCHNGDRCIFRMVHAASGCTNEDAVFMWDDGHQIHATGHALFGQWHEVPDAMAVVTEPEDGCSEITNNIYGKIALIVRGGCFFTEKVLNAQNVGAVAVVVLNNNLDNFSGGMGGDNEEITIPSVIVSMDAADLILEMLEQEPDHRWHLVCPDPNACFAHSDCSGDRPFCNGNNGCSPCSECHYCDNGIDGTCGTCGEGFATREAGPCLKRNCCNIINVSGFPNGKQWERDGEFVKMADTVQHGFHVYENEHGQYLYYWNDLQEWRIHDDYTNEFAGVTGFGHAEYCPNAQSSWSLWYDNAWNREENVSVTCVGTNFRTAEFNQRIQRRCEKF